MIYFVVDFYGLCIVVGRLSICDGLTRAIEQIYHYPVRVYKYTSQGGITALYRALA